MELIGYLLPADVVNIVNGIGPETGKPLATHPSIKKVAFAGETTTDRLIMQYASENIIPARWSSVVNHSMYSVRASWPRNRTSSIKQSKASFSLP